MMKIDFKKNEHEDAKSEGYTEIRRVKTQKLELMDKLISESSNELFEEQKPIIDPEELLTKEEIDGL